MWPLNNEQPSSLKVVPCYHSLVVFFLLYEWKNELYYCTVLISYFFLSLEQCDDQPMLHCGDGATGCSGSILHPICQCDTPGYVLAGDQHSCKPGM